MTYGKLMEEVEKLPPETNIKLGSKDGSGFFWCGQAKNLRTEIISVERSVHSRCKQLYDRALQSLNNQIQDEPTQAKFVASQIKTAQKLHMVPIITMELYLQFVNMYYKSVMSKYKLAANKKRNLDNYIPLMEREVVDIYDSIDPDEVIPTKIILLSGDDTAKYWSSREYKNGISAEDEEQYAEDE